eukprot:TRINITY_DN19330_c0_g2_i1.p1 TRINITY_DN19330_c0_g2~~TRINITY_DN19330_c0_g2_i1.p1  ORF type:complete len:329 (+),score=44.22 TRINITY_DN19330_c0_g2_i1:80-988(+)
MSGSALRDATAGSVAAVLAGIGTYPLDVVKVRLQAQHRKTLLHRASNGAGKDKILASKKEDGNGAETHSRAYDGTVDCLRRIGAEEGACSLFTGLPASCLKTALTNFIFFFNIRAWRPLLRKWPMLQGIVSGICVQLFMLPLDLLVTRIQSGCRTAKGGGLVAELLAVVRQDGVLSLWAGLKPGLLLTLNPGITQLFLVWLGGMKKGVSSGRAFLAGAVAKAIASLLTYPYTRAKVQMQVQHASTSNSRSSSISGVLGQLVAESGLASVYDGLAPQLLNAVLKDAFLHAIRVKVDLLLRLGR